MTNAEKLESSPAEIIIDLSANFPAIVKTSIVDPFNTEDVLRLGVRAKGDALEVLFFSDNLPDNTGERKLGGRSTSPSIVHQSFASTKMINRMKTALIPAGMYISENAGTDVSEGYVIRGGDPRKLLSALKQSGLINQSAVSTLEKGMLEVERTK